MKKIFEEFPNDIAGLLIEPVAGNMGCVPPEKGFLEGLRELCDKYKTCLIFDEVMTGFRVARGGAQELYGVRPDITCLGKIIGGGLPVGAYGGKKDIMACVAPEGAMYQAGTLSGNPLAMAAGFETLSLLNEPGVYEKLEARTRQLADGLLKICRDKNIPAYGTQVGSMTTLFFVEGPVKKFEDVSGFDKPLFNKFFWGMLDAGVYLAPSQYESAFVSLAHTEDDINKTLEAAKAVLS